MESNYKSNEVKKFNGKIDDFDDWKDDFISFAITKNIGSLLRKDYDIPAHADENERKQPEWKKHVSSNEILYGCLKMALDKVNGEMVREEAFMDGLKA